MPAFFCKRYSMETKIDFLKNKFIPLLQQVDTATPPAWGKMNFHQMVVHFYREAVRNANGKLVFDQILTPPDQLEKLRGFLMSDKPFRENTINPLMPDEPVPVQQEETLQSSLDKLQVDLDIFFKVYEQDPGKLIRNPFFGDLNFEQNVQLLYKHALHHLRQFHVAA